MNDPTAPASIHGARQTDAFKRPFLETIARVVVGALLAALAAGIAVAVLVLDEHDDAGVDFATASHQSIDQARQRTPGAFADLSGSIHLSLVEEQAWPIRPYVLDPSSGELRVLWPGVPGAHRTPARSPIAPQLSAVSGYPDNGPGEHGWTFQLFLVDTETGNVIRQLTTDDASSKRMPQWSPDGTRIAYHSLQVPADEIASTDTSDPGAWGVYVVDVATGAVAKVADGAIPLWSRSGDEILVLNRRGLAVYDLRRGGTFQVIDRGAVRYSQKIGINPARDAVVWTDPAGSISVYALGTESFLSMELAREIGTGIVDTYWPTFSPDGRYLAFQGIDRTPEATTLPRVIVYDLETDALAKAADISGFDFLESYISDWTIN